MRTIIGSFNDVEIVITEDDAGNVEMPVDIRPQIVDADGTVPVGPALLERCRTLFGDSMQVDDVLP